MYIFATLHLLVGIYFLLLFIINVIDTVATKGNKSFLSHVLTISYCFSAAYYCHVHHY